MDNEPFDFSYNNVHYVLQYSMFFKTNKAGFPFDSNHITVSKDYTVAHTAHTNGINTFFIGENSSHKQTLLRGLSVNLYYEPLNKLMFNADQSVVCARLQKRQDLLVAWKADLDYARTMYTSKIPNANHSAYTHCKNVMTPHPYVASKSMQIINNNTLIEFDIAACTYTVGITTDNNIRTPHISTQSSIYAFNYYDVNTIITSEKRQKMSHIGLYDIRTGKNIATFAGDSRKIAPSAACSDNSTIASVIDKKIALIDRRSMKSYRTISDFSKIDNKQSEWKEFFFCKNSLGAISSNQKYALLYSLAKDRITLVTMPENSVVNWQPSTQQITAIQPDGSALMYSFETR